MTFGNLYIIATPIGNLGDITARAVETLQLVDLIAAEDTRHSYRLLQHFQISKPMLSLHAHNEVKTTHKVIAALKEGRSVALLSDAGTPLISDPGQPLVAQAHAEGIKVVPLPGPCAAITALSAVGFAHNEFIFAGFLPAKSTQRLATLQSLANESRTVIFYEAPHRILDTLNDMLAAFGPQRRLGFTRELTKLFETIRVAELAEIAAWVAADKAQQQGEYVLVIEGIPPIKKELTDEHLIILRLLLAELPIKQATHLASQITGIRKNVLYDLALKEKPDIQKMRGFLKEMSTTIERDKDRT